jgi:hypothetical protein
MTVNISKKWTRKEQVMILYLQNNIVNEVLSQWIQ